MRKTLLASVMVVSALGLLAPAASASAQAGRPAGAQSATRTTVGTSVTDHSWRITNAYHRIELRGTWARTATHTRVTARMKDRRRDGHWVRVSIRGTYPSGQNMGTGTYYFKGGRNVYTTSRFRYTQNAWAKHAYARVCLIRNPMTNKIIHCGHWRRIF